MAISLPGEINLLGMLKADPSFVRPLVPAIVDSVMAGSPAATIGLEKGDRIVAVNEINTLVTASIIILSRRLRAAYLLDVALVYALLGFTANVLLTRLLAADRKEEKKK